MIKLDENYSLKADIASWNLYYRAEGEINPNTGRPSVSEETTYYGDLLSACKAYVDRNAKGATNVEEIAASIGASTTRIEEALKGVKENFRLGVK